MPRTGVGSCLDVMQRLKQLGFLNEAPALEIGKAIAVCVGMDDRTKHQYFKHLKTLNFIVGGDNGVWKLNYDEAERLMV